MAGISHGSLKIMELMVNKAGIDIENIEDVVCKYYDSYRLMAVAR
ncbi:hypothetical protein [Clostridium cavendishii]|nr:hypothetical protein [Clostridium cavendishii]